MNLVTHIRSESGELLHKISVNPKDIPEIGSSWVIQSIGYRYKVLDKLTDLTSSQPVIEVVVQHAITSHNSARDLWIVRVALMLVVSSFLFSIVKIGNPMAYTALLIALWASIVVGFYFMIRIKENR